MEYSRRLVTPLYLITAILVVFSAYLKLIHSSLSDLFLNFTLISIFLSIAMLIVDVSSSQFRRDEKLMWIIGFLFFFPIAGLVYIVLGRKRSRSHLRA